MDKRNEINQNFYVRGRLPAMDAGIKILAEGKGLITSTNNCTVSVLWEQGDGSEQLVKVKVAMEVENVKNPIVLEQSRRPGQITGFCDHFDSLMMNLLIGYLQQSLSTTKENYL